MQWKNTVFSGIFIFLWFWKMYDCELSEYLVVEVVLFGGYRHQHFISAVEKWFHKKNKTIRRHHGIFFHLRNKKLPRNILRCTRMRNKNVRQ